MKEKYIAFTGNPNVGKSTVFNSLTGLARHTGNWSGKTVDIAYGKFKNKKYPDITLVDLPGAYSILYGVGEENITVDFLRHEECSRIVVIADPLCLERSLCLLLQILEIIPVGNIILCINLMDEARKLNIDIDTEECENILGVKTVATSASSGEGIDLIFDIIAGVSEEQDKEGKEGKENFAPNPKYYIFSSSLEDSVINYMNANHCSRFDAILHLYNNGESEKIINSYIEFAKKVCLCVKKTAAQDNIKISKFDKMLTSRLLGIPMMLLFLFVVLYITLVGANYPSQILSDIFEKFSMFVYHSLSRLNIHEKVNEAITFGFLRTSLTVVSVMFPPMAIFFPLFTLLEDLGVLPRIAFNLDKCFKNSGACGKQAITMCMGFGCNAAGITGTRIIDSPRERIIAVLTNNFVPCNGRFPTIIAVSSMFFGIKSLSENINGGSNIFISSLVPAAAIAAVIVIGIAFTLLTSKFLSKTLLKGLPSSFILELPPYRKPNIAKILVRSLIDRTIVVLWRAVSVAGVSGIIIWLLANIKINDLGIMIHTANFFNPVGRLMGLDGTILVAFILGIPANEIVLPMISMIYSTGGILAETEVHSELRNMLIQNGWTIVTAFNVMLFSLLHFPCATTLLTIKNETKSIKWTVAAFILPTLIGFIVCVLTAAVSRII